MFGDQEDLFAIGVSYNTAVCGIALGLDGVLILAGGAALELAIAIACFSGDDDSEFFRGKFTRLRVLRSSSSRPASSQESGGAVPAL